MRRILLVEDDAWVGECYQKWLTNAGYDVQWTRDAQGALDVLESPVDLIVLDLLLPYANGIQLLHVLASHVDLMRIPVIVCSSALPSQPWHAAYGVAAVLDKTTLTPRVLRTKVQEVFDAVVAH